jgi:hypothetical protein
MVRRVARECVLGHAAHRQLVDAVAFIRPRPLRNHPILLLRSRREPPVWSSRSRPADQGAATFAARSGVKVMRRQARPEAILPFGYDTAAAGVAFSIVNPAVVVFTTCVSAPACRLPVAER